MIPLILYAFFRGIGIVLLRKTKKIKEDLEGRIYMTWIVFISIGND